MDLDLRSMIALFQILVDLFEKNLDILLDAEGYADLDLLLRATKERFQGLARQPLTVLMIPEGYYEQHYRTA